jgi:hypothetical protein
VNPDVSRSLLLSFLRATRPSNVKEILQSLGDNPELRVGERFGSSLFSWQFYGASDSNMSTINMGSSPARSVTERITNAIDAVLEREKARRPEDEPETPYEAAARWFGRPPTTVDSGIFTWKSFQPEGYDRLVQVVLLGGDEGQAPTVDVVDGGIGLTPNEFPDTILSLHTGNKITRHHLAGAFGQGGSTALAFADYTLVVSRSNSAPSIVGFSVVKLMNLGDNYKEDAYAYLSVDDEAGNFIVPCARFDEPLDLYPDADVHESLHSFGTGTLVRQLGYQLEGFEKTLGPAPGNLYHLLHYLMFDPLLPFRVVDIRDHDSPKDELITGTRNRLMRLYYQGLSAELGEQGGEGAGSMIRHYSPREMVSPLSNNEPSVGIEYWVVFNFRKSGEKVVLRGHSNELYVDRAHPIIGTLNGQNHGELTSILLRDAQLSMTARHLVLHIDMSKASKRVRTELIASTREGFKKGEAFNELMRILKNRLEEDETLYEIERELVARLLDKESEEVDQEVKNEISALLRDAGFTVKDPGDVPVGSSEGESPTTPTHKPAAATTPLDDLPTLEYPQVTRFEIVYPQSGAQIPLLDNRIVRIETDANFRYDEEDRIAIRSSPGKLEIASKSPLRGGRMYWRLRPSDGAMEGDEGEVIASLTKPDGQQLISKIPFSVLPAKREGKEKDRGLVPPFRIIPVDPFDEPEKFENVWPDVGPDEKTSVAYKAIQAGDEILVYYSRGFAPFRSQVERLKGHPSLADLFRRNYEIWIGYHAILQHQERASYEKEMEIGTEDLSGLLERERALVATVQAKQAIRQADTQQQLSRAEVRE